MFGRDMPDCVQARAAVLCFVLRLHALAGGFGVDCAQWHNRCSTWPPHPRLPYATMPILVALRRTLYELLSVRFIELQKSARASRVEQRIVR
jgi:hypothetical protein